MEDYRLLQHLSYDVVHQVNLNGGFTINKERAENTYQKKKKKKGKSRE